MSTNNLDAIRVIAYFAWCFLTGVANGLILGGVGAGSCRVHWLSDSSGTDQCGGWFDHASISVMEQIK